MGAHLEGANFEHAHLDKMTTLKSAYLDDAKLRTAIGLSKIQVWFAYEHGKGAQLPEDWPEDWRSDFEAMERRAGGEQNSGTDDSSSTVGPGSPATDRAPCSG